MVVWYTFLASSSQQSLEGHQFLPHHHKHINDLMNELERMRTSHDNLLQLLKAKNVELKRQIESQKLLSDSLEKRNAYLVDKMADLQSGGYRKRLLEDRLAPRINRGDLRTINIHLNSELEVIEYTYFNKDYLYSSPGAKLELSPVGDWKNEHKEVIATAIESTNTTRYQAKDFCHGLQRLERTKGTQYELFFKTSTGHVLEHVSIFRPFAPLQVISREIYDKRTEQVNLIMPLKGRLESFGQFLMTFMKIVEEDRSIFFTLVYFGYEGRERAKEMLEGVAKEHGYTDYAVVEKEGNFTRGKGLLAGVEAWKGGNVLMFFCDVDIHLKPHFFQKCRLHTAPSERVYYPIVFSLYNPALAANDNGKIPDLEERLIIHRNYGFWRTFGFGMVCIYRSDFTLHKGFDSQINGWGLEDVQLYHKLLRTNIEIVRSPDPNIFHIWHEKVCDTNLPHRQYKMCIDSRAAANGYIPQRIRKK